MRPLAHYRQVCRPVEGDARKLCQVELMNLTEDLLPHGHIRCRLFLFVQAVQRRVAIEVIVVSTNRRRLVARPQKESSSTRTPGAACPWSARRRDLSFSCCQRAAYWLLLDQTPDILHQTDSLDAQPMDDRYTAASHCLGEPQ